MRAMPVPNPGYKTQGEGETMYEDYEAIYLAEQALEQLRQAERHQESAYVNMQTITGIMCNPDSMTGRFLSDLAATDNQTFTLEGH